MLKTEDKDAIEAKTAALTELSGKLAERVYAQKPKQTVNLLKPKQKTRLAMMPLRTMWWMLSLKKLKTTIRNK